jgi:hypothetical protein
MSDVSNVNADLSQKGSVQQINQQQFYIEAVMYNGIPDEEPFYVPFFQVHSLEINESLHNWITRGQITLFTQFENISRGNPGSSNSEKSENTSAKNIIKAPYIDRTDGKNRVHIKVYPKPLQNQETSTTDSQNLPVKYWEINHDFIVTDIIDLEAPNAQSKKRMYKLIDERYQILLEKNLEWSTSQIAATKLGGNKKPYQLKDSEAALNPNDVLKEFLTIAGKDAKSSEKLKIGFTKDGTIDKPNINFDKIIEDEWDVGNPDNKMLYYSTANSNGLVDLHYILSRCTDKEGHPVILDYGKTSEDKGWKLNSISKYFEKSIDITVEQLIIETGVDSDKPPMFRGPTTESTEINNFFSAIASRIQKYKFSPRVSLDDNRLLNSPLHYFNHSTGEFVIKFAKNTAKNVIDSLVKIAQKGLYSYKGNSVSSPQILLNLNKSKQIGEMLKNEYSSSGEFIPENAPLNAMIMDAIFLNQAISFQTNGLTLRTPGVFINITRPDCSDKNPFDDRFLGQWLVIKTNHMFTQQSYKTDVVAVKIDSFSKIMPQVDTN